MEPVILAERGGLVVAESGPEILVIDRGTGPSEITAFVLLTIALVFGGFGLVAVFSVATDGTMAHFGLFGAAVLGIGVVAGVGLVFAVKDLRERRLRSLAALTPVAVFDRATRTYRNGSGEIIAPLDKVQFAKRMQIMSSSPKLVVVTPMGVRILKRGNPFSGGIGSLDRVLDNAVHGLPP
ncbi:hypothetical protein MDUV_17450 [Mycolicibacterium duvalii]|uniref:Uncharacterized protein n=1 Tax=Mycolicibacterium duvalii TaxID=39688 RepID=A0A7I7JYE7_9MYCO|nr:hypothetical protein MDUV_17450 [Mycolicibacterium duvalii]